MITANKLHNNLSDYSSRMWKIHGLGKRLNSYSYNLFSRGRVGNYNICMMSPPGSGKGYAKYLVDELVIKTKGFKT